MQKTNDNTEFPYLFLKVKSGNWPLHGIKWYDKTEPKSQLFL